MQVFEDVVDILDPEMNMASDDEDSYEGDDNLASPSSPPDNVQAAKSTELPKIDTQGAPK